MGARHTGSPRIGQKRGNQRGTQARTAGIGRAIDMQVGWKVSRQLGETPKVSDIVEQWRAGGIVVRANEVAERAAVRRYRDVSEMGVRHEVAAEPTLAKCAPGRVVWE